MIATIKTAAETAGLTTSGQTATAITLTWDSADPASFNANLTAFNDQLVDSGETLTLTLSGQTIANGSATLVGGQSAASLNVTDIDAAVTFAVNVASEAAGNDTPTQSATISEENTADDLGTFTFTKGGGTLAGTNTASVTVTMTGTASDADFNSAVIATIKTAAEAAGLTTSGQSATAITLTWGAGDPNSFNANLSAFNDVLIESGETLTLTLSGQPITNGSATLVGGQSAATLTVTDTDVNQAPVIWAPNSFLFASSTDNTPFNLLKFSDVDTIGSVTVTLASNDTGADIIASSGGGVTVTGGGDDNVTFTGTIAALNTYFAGNNVTYDMNDTSSDTLTVTINDGAGGTDSEGITIGVNNSSFGNGAGGDSFRFPGASVFNVNTITFDTGNGSDVIVTAWNHVNATATTYNGNDDSGDSVTVVMTAAQLNEVFSSATLRGNGSDGSGLTGYFNDNNVDNETLNLNASSWNAIVTGFQGVPHLAIAAPRALDNHSVLTEDNYFSLDTWLNSGALPALDADQTGDGTANLVVGTAGAQSLTGAGGNDILASFNSTTGSTLDGGANDDLLLGSPGDDVMTGGTGNDVLAGAKGTDTFTWGAPGPTVAAADADTIVDYDFTEGDKIDLQTLVPTITAGTATDYVKVLASGNDLLVQVDTNGTTGGAVFTTAYTLLGANTNGADPVLIKFGGQTYVITDSGVVGLVAPAGVAGEPINLGLANPADAAGDVTVTIAGVPSGWTLSEGTDNGDGTWTLQASTVSTLSITSPVSFTGARTFQVTESWTNADGSSGFSMLSDNVEVYAPGSPIFAWSGDDHLTGSSGDNLFVFSQPIGNDVIHSFDATHDKIDLIGYAGVTNFADVQSHLANDANGNALLTLADGQSITVQGVSAESLTESNFVFDQTPVTDNAGTMTIDDGAMLPLSGIINNSGTIELNGAGNGTHLQLIQYGITLQGGGQVTLSDDAANVISGTLPSVTLTNVDNTISGAGQIGDGSLTIINQGSIVATGINALVLDTGANIIINYGTLEATGSGGLIAHSDIVNEGLIWAAGGNIILQGTVSGSGGALISGNASLEFGAASSATTTFASDAAGTLVLDSFDFSGLVSGMDGNDRIDLTNLAFAQATLTYTTNQDGSGGLLIVSDGSLGASIALLGQYDATGFELSGDNASGTLVTYNPLHGLGH